MSKNNKTNYYLFITAEVMTFTFITTLQFTEYPVFLIMLIFMHMGIALFVISKKRFLKEGISVKSFYRFEYGLLAAYLPILAYTLLSYLFHYEVNEPLKVIIALILTMLCIILSIVNALKLYKYLQQK